jgi:hypothetical protein
VQDSLLVSVEALSLLALEEQVWLAEDHQIQQGHMLQVLAVSVIRWLV